MCYVRIGTSEGKEKKSSHAHKTGSWYLIGVLFKICDEYPRPFYTGAPPVTSKSILRHFTAFLALGGGEKEDTFIIV